MSPDSEEGPLLVKEEGGWKETGRVCRWKIARLCEVRAPLEALNPEPGDTIFIFIILLRGGEELGRWPIDAPMALKYAGPELELETWLI